MQKQISNQEKIKKQEKKPLYKSGDIISKKYQIIGEIASGAFGQVFKGKQIFSNEIVAIKCLDKIKIQQNQKLFDQELSILEKLKECKNCNIVNMIEYIKTEDKCYILVLEYCNQKDLQHYCASVQGNRISQQQAKIFIGQLINGFIALHKQDILHRDLKDANVFMSDNTCKIGDFGFSKQLIGDSTTTVLGTPVTMAPEILEGKKYSFPVDMYSLGVVFYKLLFGRYPFMSRHRSDLVKLIKKGNPPMENDMVDQDIKDLIKRMIEYDPSKRLTWMELFQHNLFQEYTKYYKNNLDDDWQKQITYQELQNKQKGVEQNKNLEEFKEEVYSTQNQKDNDYQNQDEYEDNSNVSSSVSSFSSSYIEQKEHHLKMTYQILAQINMNIIKFRFFSLANEVHDDYSKFNLMYKILYSAKLNFQDLNQKIDQEILNNNDDTNEYQSNNNNPIYVNIKQQINSFNENVNLQLDFGLSGYKSAQNNDEYEDQLIQQFKHLQNQIQEQVQQYNQKQDFNEFMRKKTNQLRVLAYGLDILKQQELFLQHPDAYQRLSQHLFEVEFFNVFQLIEYIQRNKPQLPQEINNLQTLTIVYNQIQQLINSHNNNMQQQQQQQNQQQILQQ